MTDSWSAARSIEASNRPWVWIKSAKVLKLTPAETILQMVLTNTGNSAAFDLSVNGPLSIVQSRDPYGRLQYRDILAIATIGGVWPGESMGPGQEQVLTQRYAGKFSEDAIAEVLAGTAVLYADQNIVYRDEFSSKPRVNTTCRYLEIRTNTMAMCRSDGISAPGRKAELQWELGEQ